MGSVYTQTHPEKVSAYIGVGQCVNNMEGDVFAAEEAIRRAQANGDEQTATSILELLNQYSASTDIAKKFMLTMEIREIGAPYFHYEGEVSMPQTIWLGLSSPDMSLEDMRWFLALNSSFESFLALEEPLLEDCLTFRLEELGNAYSVPVYYISGENDWITPTALVNEYYQTVEAPKKEMIVLPNAGHSPFVDDPEAFCAAVAHLLQK